MESARSSDKRSTSSDIPSRSGLAMLFSGGLDTTLEVAERLKTYSTLHLLTFNNGYCINMGGARRRVAELRRHFGEERLHHTEISTHPLLKTLLEGYAPLRLEFRSPLHFDLLCKMAAISELIIFAKGRGVTDVTDGTAVEQTQIFLEHPEFTAHAKPLLEAHGLRFVRPVAFDMSRDEKWRELEARGLASGVKALEKIHITSAIMHQPFCMRGIVTYFFTSPIRHLGLVKRYSLSMEGAKALWDRLVPVAERYVGERLAEVAPRAS